MERQSRLTYPSVVAAIMTLILLAACATKESIQVPLSAPLPHPKLAKMQSLSPEEKDGIIYFGKSKRYQKRGITIVSLKGDPYEIGYAHGVLLKDEMGPLFKELLYWMKSHSFGSSTLENTLRERARTVEKFIPERYIAELKGLAAGSGFDYELILMLNTASTTAKAYFCTSVAIRRHDGKLIRSRSAEGSLGRILKPVVLFIYQPSRDKSFASVTVPGVVGVWTAINESGLNFGDHSINRSPNDWMGIPNEILNREIIEKANSVEEVGDILKGAPRSRPWMHMVSDSKMARIYEYDAKNIGFKDIDEERLVLTNYTQVLTIGASYNCRRFASANNYLKKNLDEMDVESLIELNRSASISRVDQFGGNYYSHHIAIFIPETLDFWIAADPPPASRGRWVGFNLRTELDGHGKEPDPLIVSAMDEVAVADVKIDESQPWTGVWKVESNSQGGGIWAMKQEGDIVTSTKDSDYEFKGRVAGSQLKGTVTAFTGTFFPIVFEQQPGSLSFTGIMDYVGRTFHLKGKRIE